MGIEPFPARSDLAGLRGEFRPFVVEFLARIVEAKIPILLLETVRTVDRHNWLLAQTPKRTWTKKSYHLYGLAVDICPYDIFQRQGVDKLHWGKYTDAVWQKLAIIGKSLNLEWGGDFKTVNPDCAHFQAPLAIAQKYLDRPLSVVG